MPTAPTIAYYASNFVDNTTGETSAAISWVAGDIILVFGGTADQQWTLATPVRSGLTFSLVSSATTTGSTSAIWLWKATAGSSGSGTVTSAMTPSNNTAGIGVLVISGSDGVGTPQLIVGSAAKVISLTRTNANSAVACMLLDWNAVADASTDPTPVGGTELTEVPGDAITWAVYLYSWGDQGAPGTTSYGVTNHTGTVKMTGIAIEIFGAATVSASVEQEGYRFRNDDGSESAATWKAAQDTAPNIVAGATTRLRVIVNATSDVPSKNYQLEYRKVGATPWNKVQ